MFPEFCGVVETSRAKRERYVDVLGSSLNEVKLLI